MMSFFTSLSFLQSGALLSLLALLIPMLIHLFHSSRGQVVWVGNLAWFKQASKKRVTEIKVTQWLLLLIRLLLLTFLALALAQLVRLSLPVNSPNTRVYISSDWLFNASETALGELFSEHTENKIYLLNEQRLSLAEGVQPLVELSQANIGEVKSKLLESYHAKIPGNVSALLAELESPVFLASSNTELGEIPASTIVYLSDRFAQLASVEKNLQHHYQWRIQSVVNTENIPQDMHLLVLFDDDRFNDQQYINLALNFLNEAGDNSIQFQSQLISKITMEKLKAYDRPDWVVYLSAEKMPTILQRWLDQGTSILTDHGSLPLKIHSGNIRRLSRQNEIVEIYQSATLNSEKTFTPLWQDAAGQPLLVQFGDHYFQWLSGFNPQATNWVEQVNFPYALAELLSSAQSDWKRSQINASQLNTEAMNMKKNIQAPIPVPLEQWLLLLVGLLWVLERWLAEKNNRASKAVDDE